MKGKIIRKMLNRIVSKFGIQGLKGENDQGGPGEQCDQLAFCLCSEKSALYLCTDK
jgi:hypothetical protein